METILKHIKSFLKENNKNENEIDLILEKFNIYYNNLIEYNKKINLTAITEKKEVYLKHFLDSLLPLSLISKNATVIDIGTGAGFPSIPLAIVRDDIKVLACDSLNKRIVFLKDLIKTLNLNNVSLIHSRAEDLAKQHRESFDFVVARAVAPLSVLLEYTLPLIKLNGKFLAYKSINADNEINSAKNALTILGGKIANTQNYDLPNTQNRTIIEVLKIKPTPLQYPRAQNKPRLNPL